MIPEIGVVTVTWRIAKFRAFRHNIRNGESRYFKLRGVTQPSGAPVTFLGQGPAPLI